MCFARVWISAALFHQGSCFKPSSVTEGLQAAVWCDPLGNVGLFVLFFLDYFVAVYL